MRLIIYLIIGYSVVGVLYWLLDHPNLWILLPIPMLAGIAIIGINPAEFSARKAPDRWNVFIKNLRRPKPD